MEAKLENTRALAGDVGSPRVLVHVEDGADTGSPTHERSPSVLLADGRSLLHRGNARLLRPQLPSKWLPFCVRRRNAASFSYRRN